MDLILLVLFVVLIGFLVWLLTTQVPMPPGWAKAIQVIALVVMVVYVLLHLFGSTIPNVLPH